MIVGLIQFDDPLYLLLAPALWALGWWIARKSLSGLGRRTRAVAVALRALVVLLLAGALAEPHLRRESDDLAVIAVTDASRSIPRDRAEAAAGLVERSAQTGGPDDRLGVVSAAREPYVQALPSALNRDVVEDFVGDTQGTDLAAALRLAMAVLPENAAGRLLLMTDGNETSGSLLRAAQAARAAGVPVDVLPVRYDYDREVVLERLVVPPTARQGQTVNVRFVLDATRPTSGRLTLLAGGEPVDLDPTTEGLSAAVELDEGVNVTTVPIDLSLSGARRFEAFFEPDDPASDAITENNAAQAVTFVSGEGRVLVYADGAGAQTPELIDALRTAGATVEVRPPAGAHDSLVELGAYDAVVLANVSAYDLTRRQQEELRAYVHDLGGGLLMVGGPESFGAGGWIDSPLAEALPVRLDPPQKRQMPRGALALIMHSCEMPRGNYWGQQAGLAAISTLSRLDLVGVLEYDWQRGGSVWIHPLQEAGDKAAVTRAVNNLSFGDMPDFNSAMQMALTSLSQVNAGQKHCIVISDGDPAGPGQTLVQRFVDAGISISTIAVFPHGGNTQDTQKMRAIAQVTGGQYYLINQQAAAASIPQIFIKEARTVKRSLIWEGDPVAPQRVDAAAEPLRGLGFDFPALTGYVVTADREGLSRVTLRGPEDDPILAQWQHGLGRVVTFTSDAATRWNADWVGWSGFRPFWEQHLRWAMRPGASPNIQVRTEQRGDETVVVVDALDDRGDRLNFARFSGRVLGPELDGSELDLTQTGPGRYEGRFASSGAGAYVVNLRYEAPGEGGEPVRGAVQAAVVRPPADERRALSDNAALLAQVAEVTGGRVLDPAAQTVDLFSRAGVRVPVSKRPIWLLVTLLALGTFLADVAVRRVRIDPQAIARSVRKALSRRARSSEEQIGALRAARERTREQLAQRAEGQTGQEPDQQAGERAKVKFEAEPGAAPDAPLVEGDRDSKKPARDEPEAGKGEQKKKDQKDQEAGISRLMEAKRRARDSMRDEDSTG